MKKIFGYFKHFNSSLQFPLKLQTFSPCKKNFDLHSQICYPQIRFFSSNYHFFEEEELPPPPPPSSYLPPNFRSLDQSERKKLISELCDSMKGFSDRSELLKIKEELESFFLPNIDVNQGMDNPEFVAFGELMAIWFKSYYYYHIRGLIALSLVLILLYVYDRFFLKKNGNSSPLLSKLFGKNMSNLENVGHWGIFVDRFKHEEIEKIVIHKNGVIVHCKTLHPTKDKFVKSEMVLHTDVEEFEKKWKGLKQEYFHSIMKKKENESNSSPSPSSSSPEKETLRIPPVYYRNFDLKSLENTIGTILSIGVTAIGIYYLFIRRFPGGGSGGMLLGDDLQALVKTKQSETSVSDLKFDDVAGLHEQKREIKEFVDFINDFESFQEIGCTLPRGCLLVGPPGCGKTLLAKALAGECGISYYAKSGSEFVEMIVGVGPQRVRELFAEARKNQPAIVFIDEIDAIGGQRGSGQFLGRNDERENTLNQLLIEMDGFTESENVMVLAATNRVEILDSALLRSGRFDRHITIPLPNTEERKEIFELYLTQMDEKVKENARNNKDQDLEQHQPSSIFDFNEEEMEEHEYIDFVSVILSEMTPGMSGADISTICNEAAILASREDAQRMVEEEEKDEMEEKDTEETKLNRKIPFYQFEKAIDKQWGGLEKKTFVWHEGEREITAIHEAGHALVGWLMEDCPPTLKVSIIPRSSGALGFTQSLPQGDREVLTKKELEAQICLTLGGRAAEEVMFDYEFSTGAVSDLQQVNALVRTMILSYGMFPEEVGIFRFVEDDGILHVTKPYGEDYEEKVDDWVVTFTNQMYEKTLDLLKENTYVLEKIGKELEKKNNINALELKQIIGFNPKGNTPEFEKILENLQNN